jgi:hypothetical protein
LTEANVADAHDLIAAIVNRVDCEQERHLGNLVSRNGYKHVAILVGEPSIIILS